MIRSTPASMHHEIAFEMAMSAIRFGPGVTAEVGADLKELGARRTLVMTDPVVARLQPLETVVGSLEDAGIPST